MNHTRSARQPSESRARTHGSRRESSAGRTRSISAVELAALMLIAVLLVVGSIVSSSRGRVQVSMSPTRVAIGDSVWSVAQRHPIPGLSTAEAVDIILRANAVDGDSLTPGDTLLVPTIARETVVASR